MLYLEYCIISIHNSKGPLTVVMGITVYEGLDGGGGGSGIHYSLKI